MSEVLTPAQRRTLPAREALARGFPTAEEKSNYYREIGERGNAGRILLRADEAVALVDAYALLSRIAERARVKLGDAPNEAA
jgi:hypothetical protein